MKALPCSCHFLVLQVDVLKNDSRKWQMIGVWDGQKHHFKNCWRSLFVGRLGSGYLPRACQQQTRPWRHIQSHRTTDKVNNYAKAQSECQRALNSLSPWNVEPYEKAAQLCTISACKFKLPELAKLWLKALAPKSQKQARDECRKEDIELSYASKFRSSKVAKQLSEEGQKALSNGHLNIAQALCLESNSYSKFGSKKYDSTILRAQVSCGLKNSSEANSYLSSLPNKFSSSIYDECKQKGVDVGKWVYENNFPGKRDKDPGPDVKASSYHKAFKWGRIDEAYELWKKEVAQKGYIKAQFDNPDINWKDIAYSHQPYFNYEQSFDFFDDGTVVLVPMKGHTKGSVGLFLNMGVGKNYFFTGDTTWSLEGFELPAHKHALMRPMVDEDVSILEEEILRVHALMNLKPSIAVVPAHYHKNYPQAAIYPKVVQSQ